MDSPSRQNSGRVVGVAASAGGVEALTVLAAQLPSDFAAPVLVVLHLPTDSRSRLADILDRAGPLRAEPASDGTRPRQGVIYAAQPDRHLVVSDERMWLVEGPRENGVRPAADPLFRSLARTYRARSIGVVLSGTLDDGTVGMSAIAAVGGTTVVQDPAEAIAPGMPNAVLQRVRVDHVSPVDEMGPLLAALAATSAAPVLLPGTDVIEEADEGPSEFSCPDCGGVLRNVRVADQPFYRCRVGHAYAPEALGAAQRNQLDAALWTALRVLEEQASQAGRLADEFQQRGLQRAADRYRRRQEESSERVGIVREALRMEPVESTSEPDAAPAPVATGSSPE
jgi:two-component system chemotaxis response regulator CheB